jgi:methylphosphotriester-DNA--protein-cysteine methyltransferase
LIFQNISVNKAMVKHSEINGSAFNLIRKKEIRWAGNARLKIYGKLNCWSGKRMKKENRVFFKNEDEAIEHGFRPCGHCMR